MWDYLKKNDKPLVLYGTGNACERIIAELNARDIKISGIFASDGFVRDRSFAGYKVKSYDECKKEFGDMTVLLCFGSHLPNVLDNIKTINEEQELYAPDLPVVGEGLFTPQYFEAHKDDIADLLCILADQKSRDVLEDVIRYRLSGKIDYLLECETDDYQNWSLLNLGPDEIYVDLGAYTGDTISDFVGLCGEYRFIYAFEPEERNFRKLFENTKELENICLANAAVGSEDKMIMFTHGVGRGGANGKGKTRPVDQVALDSYFEDQLISSNGCPSFIKMDLEGAEEEALCGAEKVIAWNKPKMLMAAYHRIDDLWVLPKKLLSINPSYKIYLRKSPCLPCWEVNYYCI